MNSAVCAMQRLQTDMAGKAEKVGIRSDDDVMNWVKDVRAEVESP